MIKAPSLRRGGEPSCGLCSRSTMGVAFGPRAAQPSQGLLTEIALGAPGARGGAGRGGLEARLPVGTSVSFRFDATPRHPIDPLERTTAGGGGVRTTLRVLHMKTSWTRAVRSVPPGKPQLPPPYTSLLIARCLKIT